MGREKQHEPQDHHQQTHDVLPIIRAAAHGVSSIGRRPQSGSDARSPAEVLDCRLTDRIGRPAKCAAEAAGEFQRQAGLQRIIGRRSDRWLVYRPDTPVRRIGQARRADQAARLVES